MAGRTFGALRHISLFPYLASLLVVILSVSCARPLQPGVLAGDALRVENPVARPSGAGQNSAVYFTVVNPTGSDDRLVSVTGDVAAAIELHETLNDNGVMRMTPHPEGFVVPSGSVLDLKPGGKHVMLLNLRQEARLGQEIVLILTFAEAGEMQVTFPVMNK